MSGSLPFGTVTTESQLNADIVAADSITAAGTYTINFGSAITEGTLPVVSTGTTIFTGGTTVISYAAPDLAAIDLHSGVVLEVNGNGYSLIGSSNSLITTSTTISGINGVNTVVGTGTAGTFRGLFVYGGNVVVNNLTIASAVATGGAGGYAGNFAGGGGAGLGGGLFVGNPGTGAAIGATVTLSHVYFSNDSAVGGAGGKSLGGGGSALDHGSYGGGGGLGGAGGSYVGDVTSDNANGGGGIGRTAVGGAPDLDNLVSPAGTGIVNGAASGGAGQSGTVVVSGANPASGGSGGLDGGGGGVGFNYKNGGAVRSDTDGAGGGGGGVGGSAGQRGKQNGTLNSKTAGIGGHGGFGGGGGGGYTVGGNGGFGGGGGGGYMYAGAGGWGGGGAGGGGIGGFGGGKGGGTANTYAGANGKGDTYYGGGGGGGLGVGGDVFLYKNATLVINSGTLSGGSTVGGAGGVATNGATAGTAGTHFASGIFLYGNNQSSSFSPGLGQTVTVGDQIYDQKGAGNGSNVGRVILNGAGELVLSNTNSFWGGTTLEGGGTLALTASGAGGNTGISFGTGFNRLVIGAADLPNGGTFANTITNFVSGDAIDLTGLTFHSGSVTATVNGSLLKVTSGSTTDTLTVASALSVTPSVVEDSNGDTVVIDPDFTIASTADLTNDLSAINIGGVDAFSDATYVFDFVSSFAITSTQTINLTAGDTLTFNGGNATSGGGYDIANGTLAAGAVGAIGSGAITVASGAALNLNGFNQTIGDLSGAGSVTLGSGTLTEGTSNSTTFSGAISGTGELVKQGSGTLTLTGADTNSGTTTIQAGALQVGSSGTSGSIGSTSSVVDNATLIFDNSGSVSFTAPISGTGALVQQGSGVLVLGSNNSYLGNTSIDAGTLVASADASLGGGGGLVSFGGGALEWNEGANAVSSSRNVQLNAAGSIIVAGSGLVTMSGGFTGNGGLTVSGPLTLSGQVSQQGNLLVNGGSVTLSGMANFGGGLTVQAGSLNLASGVDVAFSANEPVVVNGGTFNLNGISLELTALSGTGGAITLGTGTLTLVDTGSISYAGAISGAGALIKQGTGTLLLSGVNAITGGITLAAGTMEIGSSGAIGSGTIDFSSATASLRTDGSNAPANTITRFVSGDTIDLHGITYASGDTPTYNSATGELDIVHSGNTVASLFFGQNNGLATATFTVAQESGGTGIVVTDNVPCFLRGTMIGTPRGEVPVENLTVGGLVNTLSGTAKPIVWIGTGRILITRGRRCAATPIVVRKSALADNVPHHDLRITKGHALFLDGVLIPAEFLINHRSIAWDDRAQEVEFYHIETAQHDVLLANAAPAETYRDDGNRWLFRNANSGWDLPPKPVCAPVLTGGALVDAVWRRLLERAGPRPAGPLTDDPDLHLMADGQRCDGVRHGCWHTFLLPHPPVSLRIVSRAASPAELGLARDPRVLGVALRQIRIRQGTRFHMLAADDAALADGFHAFEPDCGHRWTDGDAAIRADFLEGFAGPCEVLLEVAATARYHDEGRRQVA